MKNELRLINLLSQFSFEIQIKPDMIPHGRLDSFERIIELKESWEKNPETLWHEATHAVQWINGNFWVHKPLGFMPNQKGHTAWMHDRPCYNRSHAYRKMWDIEREARYVQVSKKNQQILLDILEDMVQGVDRKEAVKRHIHKSKVERKYDSLKKPILALCICLNLIPPPPLITTDNIPGHTSSQADYDMGDCK